MRLRCTFCSKSVSTEVQDRTIVRAILVCPECLEAGRVSINSFATIPELDHREHESHGNS